MVRAGLPPPEPPPYAEPYSPGACTVAIAVPPLRPAQHRLQRWALLLVLAWLPGLTFFGHWMALAAPLGVPVDAELFRFVTGGIPGTAMPAWGGVLTEAQRWDLVNYLRDAFGERAPDGGP